MIKSKLVRRVVVILALLIVVVTILGYIDINRFMKDEEPIFIIKEDILNDGGTKIYYGVGYQLIDWKVIDDTEDTDFSHFIGKEYHVLAFHDIDKGPTIELKSEKNVLDK